MNSVRPNNLSLIYQRFTSSDCKDIGIRLFEFVAKTQLLFSFCIKPKLGGVRGQTGCMVKFTKYCLNLQILEFVTNNKTKI